MADKARRITLEEQRELEGRQLPAQRNYVPAGRGGGHISLPPRHEVMMDVQHTAHQIVHVETSAVDRAKGYQLVITPLAVLFGLVVVVVSLRFGNSFFTLASLTLWLISFFVFWLAGWIVTALASPEFVSWYGAKRQWDEIEREGERRWEAYRWQAGMDREERVPVSLQRDATIVRVILLLVGIAFSLFVFAAILEGVL